MFGRAYWIEKRPLRKSKVVRQAVLIFLEAYWIEKRPLRKSKVVRRAVLVFLEGLLD